MLLAFLRRILEIEPASPRDPYAASAQELWRLVPVCPVCSSNLDGHCFATLAEAGNEADMESLMSAFELNDWARLSSISSFEWDKNAFVAKAISCPNGAGFAVATISYFELWWDDDLIRSNALDQAQWSALTSAFPNTEWHPFSLPHK